MTDQGPRITPLAADDIEPGLRSALESLLSLPGIPNGVATLARRPSLVMSWAPLMGYLRHESTIDARTVEIVVLRTCFRAGCGYEWGQHVRLAREAGLTDDEIVHLGTETIGSFTSREQATIAAVDGLVAQVDIDDETYAELSRHCSAGEIIDLTALVGNYVIVAMTMNALRIESDAGTPALGCVD